MKKGIIGDSNSRPVGRFSASWIQPPWVRCCDRMPADDALVLFVFEGKIFDGFHTRETWLACCSQYPDGLVQFWMDRPALPTPPA